MVPGDADDDGKHALLTKKHGHGTQAGLSVSHPSGHPDRHSGVVECEPPFLYVMNWENGIPAGLAGMGPTTWKWRK